MPRKPDTFDREARQHAFDHTATAGPVTTAELVVALETAADQFDADDLSAVPFRRIVKRLLAETPDRG